MKVEQILQLKRPDLKLGDQYICWISSGHAIGIYDETPEARAVNPPMIVSAIDSAKSISAVSVSESPFEDWTFPKFRCIRVEQIGHADLYCLPVNKDNIIVAFDDNTLGHSVETPDQLQDVVNERPNSIERLADSPFRRYTWTV